MEGESIKRASVLRGIALTLPNYASAGILTTTTENIGRPYEVVDGVCVYQQFADFSLKQGPLPKAVTKAFKQIETFAVRTGADALVNYDVDFANRTEKDEGRVPLCGTLVEFK